MKKRIWTILGFWAMGLILFVATIIIVRWMIDFVTWSTLDSGWAQAIGSIAALGVAIYIMNEQHRRERARSADEAAERRLGLIRAAVGIGFRTCDALKELERVIKSAGFSPANLRYEQAVFAQLLASIGRIPTWEMGGQEGNSLQSLAAICATTSFLIEAAIVDGKAKAEPFLPVVQQSLVAAKQMRDYLVLLSTGT